MNSALPRMVQPVASEARLSLMRGVRPTAAATPLAKGKARSPCPMSDGWLWRHPNEGGGTPQVRRRRWGSDPHLAHENVSRETVKRSAAFAGITRRQSRSGSFQSLLQPQQIAHRQQE